MSSYPAPWIVAAALLSFPAVALSGTDLREAEIGKPLPPFSAWTADGTEIKSESYRGKVLLLVFARPEHDKSLEALKLAQDVLAENRESKLTALGISTKPESDEYFKRVASEHGLAFPIATDPGRKTYGEIGVVVAPTTLLIDETGVLRFVLPHLAVGHEHRLRVHVDLLLEKIGREEHDRRLSLSDQSEMTGQDGWTRRLGFAERVAEQRKFAEAAVLLAELRTQKDTPEVAVLLGVSLLELGRVDEAAACLDPLAGAKVKSPKIKVALARLALARGDDPAAERYLVDALRTAPTKGPILYQLGQLYERRGDLAKAAEAYRGALEEVYGGR